jgi:hypothetical protein
MYHADPADEGEPSSGFYHLSFPIIFLSFLLLSCHERNNNIIITNPVAQADTVKPPAPKPPVAEAKPAKRKRRYTSRLTMDQTREPAMY